MNARTLLALGLTAILSAAAAEPIAVAKRGGFRMMLKTILFGAAFFGCAMCSAATLLPGKTEVVIAPGAPKTVRFAATEMTNLLSQVLGAEVPLACSSENCTHEGFASIILGDNAWLRAAGLDVAQLARDGFWTKAEGNKIYIAGRDDPKVDLAEVIRAGRTAGPVGSNSIKDCGEHATLFGVYDFLEKYAGSRFYFAHPCGTIVPRRDRLTVPARTDKIEPKWTVRNVYMNNDGAWPDETDADAGRKGPKCLDWLRLRLGTVNVTCCHGFNYFTFSDRFGKTHPEWFALVKGPDGKPMRMTGIGDSHPAHQNQMCWSNPEVWDRLLADILAHERGESAASLGITRLWDSGPDGWGPQFCGESIDLEPQDGMLRCLCEKCQAAYEPDRGPSGWCTEFMWSKWAAFANRLAAAGCKRHIRLPAYSGWRLPPKCRLPPNVDVEVSQQGPWRWRHASLVTSDTEILKAWTEKSGHKVWMWTYPAKAQDSAFAFPGVPDIAPKTWGEYYRHVSQWSEGSFCESECDAAIYHYLNYYVFAKLAWNPDLDLDALLDEHDRLMFGAGAAEMKAFYETCEEKWMGRVAGSSAKETNLGYELTAPSRPEMWTDIWSPSAIAEAKALFARAAERTAGDAGASARVAFMKRQLLDPLVAASERNLDHISVRRAQERRRARKGVKNLFEDPEFGARWNKNPNATLDTTTFVSAPHALKLTNADGKSAVGAIEKHPEGLFKPNTRYRISFFVKLDNVVRAVPRGHSCWFDSYDGKSWHCVPGDQESLQGTADWFYCEVEFKTGDLAGARKGRDYIGFEISNFVSGTAWFDDPVLEELGPVR